VTGASGFLAAHVLRALAAAGHATVPLSRETPFDVTSESGLSEPLAGCDAVLHLAARNHVLREESADPLGEYRRVNAAGTRHVLRAAARAGVRRFVLAGSVKAMGEGGAGVLDEESPCRPSTPYGASKLEAEEILREEAPRLGVTAAILRLPMVYGPGNRGNFPRVVRWASRGLPFPSFRPSPLRSLLYAENGADAFAAALSRAPEGRVSTYLVRDGEDRTPEEMYEAICRALGRKGRVVPVPAAVTAFLSRHSGDVRRLALPFRVDSSRARREIGFEPVVPFDEAVRRSVAWQLSASR
jgi:UDP-glucose 4-epimerase